MPYNMMRSRTLLSPFAVEGVGLHTGAAVRVEVCPVSTPCGRVFIREGVEIPATVDNVTETRRCTTLGRVGQTISTVEHLLAALLLADIAAVRVVVDGPELPALDGAALQWFSLINTAGVCPLDGECPVIAITETEWFHDGESDFFLFPAPALHVYAALDVPGTIARQRMVGGPVAEQDVRTQMLRARTWGLEREVQALRDAGLAQGGSLENAVILSETGFLNDQVWPDEPAWHKVLDLLGDLALTGAHIAGGILAVRAGHRSHLALARYLRRQMPGISSLP